MQRKIWILRLETIDAAHKTIERSNTSRKEKTATKSKFQYVYPSLSLGKWVAQIWDSNQKKNKWLGTVCNANVAPMAVA